MNENWTPGDVAHLDYNSSVGGRAIRVAAADCRDDHPGVDHWHFASGQHGVGSHAGAVRRLVVIDPEDREQVERLMDMLADALNWGPHNIQRETYRSPMQAALREFANPTPPKPTEPRGLGAVVQAADDDRYVRHCPGDCPDKDACIPWSRVAWGTSHSWVDVPAVRVLSEGIS